MLEVHRSAIIGQTANFAPLRKSDCQLGCPLSVGGAVAVIQHPFDVGFTVEDFTTQLDIGDTPLITVILKCPTAYLQPCRYLLVGKETLTAQCRAVVGGQMLKTVKQTVEAAHEVDYPLVVLVNQFIHVTLDLVGIVIIVSSYSLSFEPCFLSPVLHNGNDTFHIFGTVVRLVIDLAVCQSSIVPKRLQCTWADAEHPAHVLIVHPLAHCLFPVPLADSLHAADKTVEPCDHCLKSSFFD
jgi:hypothetical protein